MTTPDFTRIFAEGGLKDTITDADYDGGWDDIVGGLPPTKEEFNSIMNEQDNKLRWLVANLSIGQFFVGGGAADAYTANVDVPRVNPLSRIEGMVITSQAVATNTGACTLNAFDLGVDDIKLKGGVLNPDAGDIVAGQDFTVIDRLTHFELDRTGKVKFTLIGASDAAWATQPDTKTIEFLAVGGGGGGGGVNGVGSGTAAVGVAGGGAGACQLTTSVVETTYAIVIGAGGANGTGTPTSGTGGGTTTVTGGSVNLNAAGGNGGSGRSGSAGTVTIPPAAGGFPTGGDVNTTGSAGSGLRYGGGDLTQPSMGGTSILGGQARLEYAVPHDGLGYGAGGSGGAIWDQTTNVAGGSGRQGVVMIKEYL